jgi:hypothetical protein
MKSLHLSSHTSCSSGIVSNPCALFEIPTNSVHYHRTLFGASCHGRIENQCISPVKALPQFEMDRIPMFIHTFASTANCSLRTQSGAVAHLMPPEHKKSHVVMHRCCHRCNKKLKKQQRLLQEIVPPHHILENLLTNDDIENDIIVLDGGDIGNPSICPPRNVSVPPLSFHQCD